MASWYYVISDTREKSGPHDEAYVRSKFIAGELTPQTLVWHEGTPTWIPAGEAFASLKTPAGTEGKVPLPDGLRGWMTFVGVLTILSSLFPALMLYGIPMLLAGIAVLGARSALDRAPFISPDMVPFFRKLKKAFACWGWMYIIALFAAVLSLLAYSGLLLWMLSTSQPVPYPFCTPS
jgi:GYF domain 2